jgi:hypothetical protein
MNDWHIDITAIAGLVALGMIGVVAINHGDGETVAAAAVGAIGGWMAREVLARSRLRPLATLPLKPRRITYDLCARP